MTQEILPACIAGDKVVVLQPRGYLDGGSEVYVCPNKTGIRCRLNNGTCGTDITAANGVIKGPGEIGD